MISFDQAAGIVASVATPLGKESVPIEQANRRTLAEPAVAAMASPTRPVSTMDGYAARAADLSSVPAFLPVVQEIFPGMGEPSPLPRGACARIFTGAAVPHGADVVVMQEQVERDGDVARFDQPASAGRNIRTRASDFGEGTLLVEAGRRLGPRELVAAAGGDCGKLTCWRRPTVIVLATGDELAPPGEARQRPGAVPESVTVGIASLVDEWGGVVVATYRLADQIDALEVAAARAVDQADLVVVTGGASVGAKDFARRMFEPTGLDLLFAKVAMKPGKPVWLGRCGTALVMGLPGNPTSALVTGRLLLAPLVAGMAGRDPASAWDWQPMPVAPALPASGDRETFTRGRQVGNAIEALANQDSGAQMSLAAADVLIRQMPNASAVSVGQTAEVLAF